LEEKVYGFIAFLFESFDLDLEALEDERSWELFGVWIGLNLSELMRGRGLLFSD
jgi:hypothetical protein